MNINGIRFDTSKSLFFSTLLLVATGCGSAGGGGDDYESYADYCAKSVGTKGGDLHGDNGQSGEISYSWTGDTSGAKLNKKVRIIPVVDKHSYVIYDDAGDINDLTIRTVLPLNAQSSTIPGNFAVAPSGYLGSTAKTVAFSMSGALKDYLTHAHSCAPLGGKLLCEPVLAELHDPQCSFNISSFEFHDYDRQLAKGAYIIDGSFTCELAKRVANWPTSDDTLLTTQLTGSFKDICVPEVYMPLIKHP